MSWSAWRQWLRLLKENPVYRREKGEWGQPNALYEKLSRFSPFVVLAAIFMGFCAGSSNTAYLANDELAFLWCLLCLPGMLLSMLTNFGVFMAPALTASIVGGEVSNGSWDLLRLTPQPTGAILLAKLLGALARLRIWLLLFALSLLQGVLLLITAVVTGEPPLLWSVLLGVMAVIRPWLEILFAAALGMYISTWVQSSMIALMSTYGGVLLVKLFNGNLLWAVIMSSIDDIHEGWIIFGSIVAPALIYLVSISLLAWGIYRRAEGNRFGALA